MRTVHALHVRAYDKGGTANLNTENNLDNWTDLSAPTIAAVAGPRPGTTAYRITDDSGAAAEGIERLAGFLTDGPKPWAIEFAKGAVPNNNTVILQIWDDTASFLQAEVLVTWNGNVPIVGVSGTLVAVYPIEGGFWRAEGYSNAVTAANSNRIRTYATSATVGNTGDSIVHRVLWGDTLLQRSDGGAPRVRFRDEFPLIFSSHGFTSKPTDTPGHWHLAGRIRKPVTIQRRLFGGAGFDASRASIGEALLDNTDGALDGFRDYAFDGRQVIAYKYTGASSALAFPGDFVKTFDGVLANAVVGRDTVTLIPRDRSRELAVPLQTNRYGGTNSLPNGLDGVSDLKGKTKPVIYGKVKNVTPPCVNTSKLIYQVHDGAVASIDMVFDRGVPIIALGAFTSRTNPLGNTLRAIGYSEQLGLFVAGHASSADNGVITSPDGITWTSRTIGGGLWWDVNFGNGLFVIVGDDGGPIIYTSPDGITWTSRTSNHPGTSLRCVRYGGGLWIAGGDSGDLVKSTDGITWAAASSPPGSAIIINDVVFAFGAWFAVTDDGDIYRSTDGDTWTSVYVSSASFKRITFGNDRLVIVGNTGIVVTSVDGVIWETRTVPGLPDQISGLSYGWGHFLAAGTGTSGQGARVATSTDGISWTTAEVTPGTNNLNRSAFGSRAGGHGFGAFVVAGSAGLFSSGGVGPSYASEADLLNDTLAPLPGQFKPYLAGGLFRLGATPAGTVTADVIGDGSGSAAEIIEDLLVRRAGLWPHPVSLITEPDFSRWDDEAGTPTVTPGQSDPWGGTRGYLVRDDSGAAGESKSRALTSLGGGTRRGRILFKKGADVAPACELAVHRSTSGQNGFALNITAWTGDSPTSFTVPNGFLLSSILNRPNGWRLAYFETEGRADGGAWEARIEPTDLSTTEDGDVRLVAFSVFADDEHTEADLMYLDLVVPAQLGYWAGPDTEPTIADVLNEIGETLGMWWGVDRSGQYRFKLLEDPHLERNGWRDRAHNLRVQGTTSPFQSSAITILANDRADPEGRLVVDKIEETAANDFHRIVVPLFGSALTDGADAEVSFDVYADERTRIYVDADLKDGSQTGASVIVLTDGSLAQLDSQHTITVVRRGSDGWRVTVGFNIGSGANPARLHIGTVASGTTTSFAGSVGSGVHLGALRQKVTVAAITQYAITSPLERTPATIPPYKHVVEHSRNYTPQTDLAGGVSDANKELFARTHLDESAEDLTVQAAHYLATEARVRALFTTAADALAEARRRQAIHGMVRETFEFGIEAQDDDLRVDLGRVITLTHDRFSLSAGEDFVIVAVDPQGDDGITKVGVWG